MEAIEIVVVVVVTVAVVLVVLVVVAFVVSVVVMTAVGTESFLVFCATVSLMNAIVNIVDKTIGGRILSFGREGSTTPSFSTSSTGGGNGEKGGGVGEEGGELSF